MLLKSREPGIFKAERLQEGKSEYRTEREREREEHNVYTYQAEGPGADPAGPVPPGRGECDHA